MGFYAWLGSAARDCSRLFDFKQRPKAAGAVFLRINDPEAKVCQVFNIDIELASAPGQRVGGRNLKLWKMDNNNPSTK